MAHEKPAPDELDLYPYIDLRKARLCLDCEMIFQGTQCPACTSRSFVPLTRWIRATERPPQELPPAPPQPLAPPSKTRRILKKTVYVGLGAYGVWKMLFEPVKSRRTRQRDQPPDKTDT